MSASFKRVKPVTELLTMTAKIGRRYRVTFKVDPAVIRKSAVIELDMEWQPTVPKRLSKRKLRDYYRARSAFFAQQAAMLGGNSLAVDLHSGRMEVIAPARGDDGPAQ